MLGSVAIRTDKSFAETNLVQASVPDGRHRHFDRQRNGQHFLTLV